MADGKIRIETLLDTTGISKGLDKMDGIVKKGGAAVLKTATGAITAVSGLITGLGAYAVKVGSTFEASMSQVSAVSGATGEELDALTEKAKEMGQKTQFSASQAADAMNYMAMAGWKTEEMLSGIDGIMNLAAASGEDLATTSDIVTDALTAFGLSAKDSNHFADVLAKTSSNANTNVGLLGETFKYVAPVAGSLGYKVEDTAVAIGLMANAGIKGSQAGTALRSMMTRLAKPTDQVADAMDALGVSLTDSKGEVKPLNDLLEEMRGQFKNLTDAEKAQYAATLAGQEGMSGLLAIVNASEEDFTKLTEAVNNADGAAEQMADTMMDNLQGSIKLAQSALESFGIEIYESVDGPLKDIVDTATDSINQLTNAFKEGGTKGAAQAAGDIMANLVTGLAEKLPDIIDTAVLTIQAFIDGIKKNKKKLAQAALDIVKALVDGLASLLPKEIGVPIKKTFDGIGKSLKSGGLKSGINAAINMIKRLIKVIGNIIDKVGPVLVRILDFIGKHFDVIGPAVLGVITAMMTFKKVLPVITAVTTAVKALNAGLSATPLGIITAIIAAVAGLATYMATAPSAYDKAYESAAKLTDKEQELIDKVAESKDIYNDRKASIKEAFSGIETEFAQTSAHVHDLQSELADIVNADGTIKAGYEERAQEIVSELEDALGIEIKIEENTIQNYDKIISQLDTIIEKRKAEALAGAFSEDYQNALKEHNESMSTYLELQDSVKAKELELAGAQNELSDAQKRYNELLENHERTRWEEMELDELELETIPQLQGTVDGLAEAYGEMVNSLADAEDAYSDNLSAMANYEALQEAIATGSVEDLIKAENDLANSTRTAETAVGDSLKRQVFERQKTLDEMVRLQREGSKTITDEQIAEQRRQTELARAELMRMADSYDEISIVAMTGFLQNIHNGIFSAEEAVGLMTPAMVEAFKQGDLPGKLSAESNEALDQLLAALNQQQAADAMTGLMDSLKTAVDGADLSNGITDPVKDALNEMFAAFDGKDAEMQQAMANVIAPMLTELAPVGSELYEYMAANAEMIPQAIMDVLDMHSPSRRIEELMLNVGEGAKAGLEGNSDLSGSAEDLADTILSGLKNANLANVTSMQISQMVTAMVQALRNGTSSVTGATNTLMNAIRTALRNANLYSMALAAGQNFGEGLRVGISQKTKSIADQAAATVRAAIEAANAAQRSASPAKELIKSGHYFGEGYEIGIEDKTPDVAKAGSGMAKAAIEGINDRELLLRARAAADGALYGSVLRMNTGAMAAESAQSGISDAGWRVIAEKIGEIVSDKIGDFTFLFNQRELGRMVKASI